MLRLLPSGLKSESVQCLGAGFLPSLCDFRIVRRSDVPGPALQGFTARLEAGSTKHLLGIPGMGCRFTATGGVHISLPFSEPLSSAPLNTISQVATLVAARRKLLCPLGYSVSGVTSDTIYLQ